MLAAGKLNRQVLIEQRDTGVDEFMQPRTTWTAVCQPWASILHKSGAESIRGGAETSAVQASFRIRYRTNITAGMRLRLGTRVYDIQAVLPDESRREHVDLVCEITDAVF